MRNIFLTVIVASLIGCGSSGGDDEELTVNRPPTNSSSECDGDVVFHAAADEPTDVPSDSSAPVDATEPEGCELSPICRLAKSQGLRVVSLEKFDGVTIIGTCDATINVNVDSGNVTTDISGAAPE